MNWDAIGAIAEIAGAVAVIFSLIYLARQIRMSASIEQASSEREVMSAFTELQLKVAGTPELANIFLSGLVDPSQLTNAERVTFTTFCTSFLAHNLMLMEMHEKKLLQEDVLKSSDQLIVSILKSPGARTWWEEFGPTFPPRQFERVNEMLESDTQTPAISESDFYF